MKNLALVGLGTTYLIDFDLAYSGSRLLYVTYWDASVLSQLIHCIGFVTFQSPSTFHEL
jgi:hypothetical protein